MKIAQAIQTQRHISRTRPLLISFAVSGAIQVMNVASGTILARQLGPVGRGELAALILWPNILAALGSLGVAEALTYYLARAGHPPKRLIESSLGLCLIQSLMLVTIGLVAVPRALAGYGPHVVSLTCLYLAFIPLNLTAMYLMAALNGLHLYARYHWLRLVNIAVTVIGIAYLALTGRLTLDSAVTVYLLAWFLTAAGAALALRSRTSVRLDGARAKQLLSFGLKSHCGFLSSVLNEWLDKLLISVVLAPASLGLYMVAVTLTSVTGLVGSSVSIVALPLIAGMEDGDGRSEKARQLAIVTLVISVIITIPSFIFLPAVTEVAFGSQFSKSVGPARILLVAAVILSVNRVLTAILRAIGRPLDAGIGESIALVVTLIGMVFLLRRFALIGAAITSLAAYLTSMIWMIRRVGRMLCLPAMAVLIPDRGTLLLLRQMGEVIGASRSTLRRG
jgi:O-antigen/teichoic acid export membrane protein